MSREVRVVIRCDKCGRENAEPQPERNSRGELVEIDLDPPCHDELEALKARAAQILAPLTDLVDEKGMAPEKVAKAKTPAAAGKAKAPTSKKVIGDRICLACPETRSSDTGILNHMTEVHNYPRGMVEIFGTFCPLDGEEYPRVAQHIAQIHKEHTHVSRAFAWAKENGDPHGVVAKRIAELQKMAAAA